MDNKKIKVLICDDMIYMCDFFEILINNNTKLTCCGKAHNEAQSLTLAKTEQPDIILLDIQMDSKTSGIDIMPQLLENSPNSKIIIISVHEDKKIIFDAISTGAKDYILKNQSPEEIIQKIESVYENKNLMDDTIIHKLTAQYAEIEQRQKSLLFMFNELMSLTKRELNILRSIYNGKTYAQIAKEEFVEEVTIRTHMHRILKKLGHTNTNTLITTLKELQIFDFLK